MCLMAIWFSNMKDNDKDSYPDISLDDFPNDSTLANDTDGDGWPDPGHGINIDSLIDIDVNNNNILDSEENFENLGLKATILV